MGLPAPRRPRPRPARPRWPQHLRAQRQFVRVGLPSGHLTRLRNYDDGPGRPGPPVQAIRIRAALARRCYPGQGRPDHLVPSPGYRLGQRGHFGTASLCAHQSPAGEAAADVALAWGGAGEPGPQVQHVAQFPCRSTRRRSPGPRCPGSGCPSPRPAASRAPPGIDAAHVDGDDLDAARPLAPAPEPLVPLADCYATSVNFEEPPWFVIPGSGA